VGSGQPLGLRTEKQRKTLQADAALVVPFRHFHARQGVPSITYALRGLNIIKSN